MDGSTHSEMQWQPLESKRTNYTCLELVKYCRSEVYAIGKYYMIKSFGYTYDGASISLIMFVMFSVYVSAFPDELTPRKVFVALSLITFLRLTSVFLVIHLILNGSDAKVAWKRIKVIHIININSRLMLGFCSP